MHVILRELATPGNPLIYPMIDINEDILSKTSHITLTILNLSLQHHTLLIAILLIVILVIIRISRCCQ